MQFSFASSWQIFVCLIELDVLRDTTFMIGDRLSFGNNKNKRVILHPEEVWLRSFKHRIYEHKIMNE